MVSLVSTLFEEKTLLCYQKPQENVGLSNTCLVVRYRGVVLVKDF